MNQSISSNSLATSIGTNDDDAIDLASYLDLLIDHRWLITAVALAVTLIGAAYAFIATPIYQANMLIQVEDSTGSPTSVFGELAGAFEMKSAATAEMEILRSRYVVGRAIRNAGLDLTVDPKRFPFIGTWIARGEKDLSTPGLLGLGGYTWGAERAEIDVFEVPSSLEGVRFTVTALGDRRFRVTQSEVGVDGEGAVGLPTRLQSSHGVVNINISELVGNPGATFHVVRHPMLDAILKLQQALTISERGKQSGIIGVSLDGANPASTARTLNEIGQEYIRQNVERKSEEAQKSLAFLEKQLPVMKASLEQAEERYNALRNRRGTVDLNEEAKTVLQQSVLAQTRLVELRQKRDELLTRYQPSNPIVQAVDRQLATLNAEINAVNGKIKRMPEIEQDVLRLTRDIKVNTDLYSSLLNSAQQLRLVKASKVGNARLLDEAVTPRYPVRPRRSLIIVMAALFGVVMGIGCAFLRKSLFGGIEEPHEVEQLLGLTVSAAIPHSARQDTLSSELDTQARKVSVLAQDDPTDLAIESLRSFRTSLQFSMLGAKNKIVMITGPTPGVGKSFVSVNFAAVLASTGKKVLLIDGDLRKGYLHRYFGLDRQRGLSEVIAADIMLTDAVHRNVVQSLDFVSTGVFPPRPAELLEHINFTNLLAEVCPLYDYIVIDTAPVLAVTDAMIVAPHVGTIFNVVRGNVSTLGEIEESVKRLRNSGINVAGVVFNDLKQRAGRYGFGSKYGKYRYAQYKY